MNSSFQIGKDKEYLW